MHWRGGRHICPRYYHIVRSIVKAFEKSMHDPEFKDHEFHDAKMFCKVCWFSSRCMFHIAIRICVRSLTFFKRGAIITEPDMKSCPCRGGRVLRGLTRWVTLWLRAEQLITLPSISCGVCTFEMPATNKRQFLKDLEKLWVHLTFTKVHGISRRNWSKFHGVCTGPFQGPEAW